DPVVRMPNSFDGSTPLTSTVTRKESPCRNVVMWSAVATRQTTSSLSTPVKSPSTAERLVSLDAFRGAIIALMVLVNDPGDGQHVYGPLNHAAWHGWTITD